jgi:hypothetical protein
LFDKSFLFDADHIFTTNVSGLKSIVSVEQKNYNPYKYLDILVNNS